jgi:hypothetical protein
MTQIVGLFSTHNEADRAVEALSATRIENKNIHTLVAAPGIDISAALDLEEEKTSYFKRSVQNGGVLVLVDLADDAHITRAMHVLAEYGSLVEKRTSPS